jgi:hypothetical protein
MNGNILFGSLFLTLAIQIKLLPLILLPFLWRLLGIQKSLAVYLLILGFNIWISLPFLGPENIFHLLEAIKLYFGNFEFNSLVLYNYVQYGKWKLGWNPVKYYAPYLSRVAVKIILVTSLYGEYSQWEKFFRRVTIGLFAYLLLTSTVHPWYLVSLLLFSILSGYVFAIVWSITVFLSYVIYSDIDFSVQRTLIILEYIPVLILFTYEMIKGGLLFKWLPQDSFSEDFSSLGGTGS